MLTKCPKNSEQHFIVILSSEQLARYIKMTTINDILGHTE